MAHEASTYEELPRSPRHREGEPCPGHTASYGPRSQTWRTCPHRQPRKAAGARRCGWSSERGKPRTSGAQKPDTPSGRGQRAAWGEGRAVEGDDSRTHVRPGAQHCSLRPRREPKGRGAGTWGQAIHLPTRRGTPRPDFWTLDSRQEQPRRTPLGPPVHALLLGTGGQGAAAPQVPGD